MTKLSIDSKFGAAAAFAVEDYVRPLYDQPGLRLVGVVELAHVERTQPAPGSEKDPSVKARITALEIASKDQEDAIREVMRALHLQRTADGTLDEHGQVVLTKATLDRAGMRLLDVEFARLRAGLVAWSTAARAVANSPRDLLASELRHEIGRVADGLAELLDRASAYLDPAADPDDGDE